MNGNAPVSIAGGNISSGPSSATQNATSNATTNVSNDATTHQNQWLTQNVGGSSCHAGCGGAGGFQLGLQNAKTNQGALGLAFSNQNAVNSNTPHSIGGRKHLRRLQLRFADADVDREHRRQQQRGDRNRASGSSRTLRRTPHCNVPRRSG